MGLSRWSRPPIAEPEPLRHKHSSPESCEQILPCSKRCWLKKIPKSWFPSKIYTQTPSSAFLNNILSNRHFKLSTPVSGFSWKCMGSFVKIAKEKYCIVISFVYIAKEKCCLAISFVDIAKHKHRLKISFVEIVKEKCCFEIAKHKHRLAI